MKTGSVTDCDPSLLLMGEGHLNLTKSVGGNYGSYANTKNLPGVKAIGDKSFISRELVAEFSVETQKGSLLKQREGHALCSPKPHHPNRGICQGTLDDARYCFEEILIWKIRFLKPEIAAIRKLLFGSTTYWNIQRVLKPVVGTPQVRATLDTLNAIASELLC
nr:hypothetical protein Iba_chr10fCG2150 [Ipomoea batatas]